MRHRQAGLNVSTVAKNRTQPDRNFPSPASLPTWARRPSWRSVGEARRYRGDYNTACLCALRLYSIYLYSSTTVQLCRASSPSTYDNSARFLRLEQSRMAQPSGKNWHGQHVQQCRQRSTASVQGSPLSRDGRAVRHPRARKRYPSVRANVVGI